MKKWTIVPIAVICVLLMMSTCVLAATGGSDFGSATLITNQRTSISFYGSETYFKFVASESGTFDIYTEYTNDSVGYLYNSAGSQVAYNDDAGESWNFKISYNLTAGQTYYIGVYNYWGNSDSGDLIIEANITVSSGPVVTDENISISGATGTNGEYIIGDIVTASWDNTSSGDNNADIASVSVDFSEFGGSSVDASANQEGTWSASYTITEESADGNGLNVSVTATNGSAESTTTADTSNAIVDSRIPQASIRDNKSGVTFKRGEVITITADFNESMAPAPLITITNSSVSDEPMTGSGDDWSYVWTVPADTGSMNVIITGYDLAGNPYDSSTAITYKIDNKYPMISGVDDGGVYAQSRRIYFNEGTAALNGADFCSGSLVDIPGEYVLTVTDSVGNKSSVSFEICLEAASTGEMSLVTVERDTNRLFTDVKLIVDSDALADTLATSETGIIDIDVEENPYDSSVRHYELRFTPEDIKMMTDAGTILDFSTPVASMIIDPAIIDSDAINGYFTDTADSDIIVSIGIKPAYASVVNMITDIRQLPETAVAVTFTCTDGKTTLSRSTFSGNYELMIPFPAEEPVEMTGARLMPDMTLKAFDTEIINGQAVITTDMSGIFTLLSE